MSDFRLFCTKIKQHEKISIITDDDRDNFYIDIIYQGINETGQINLSFKLSRNLTVIKKGETNYVNNRV